MSSDTGPTGAAAEKLLNSIHQLTLRDETARAIALLQKNAVTGLQISRQLADVDVVMGRTPLHIACERGNLKLVTFMVENGAPLDAIDKSGCTPFHYAAGCGFAAVVKFLAAKMAMTTVRDKRGDTPLHWCASNGDTEEAKQMRGTEAARAENADHAEVIKVLVGMGSSPDAPNEAGWTPLHKAAFKGHADHVSDLIDLGASVNATNKAGETALHLAAASGGAGACTTLVKKGAKLTLVDHEGRSPAECAGNATLREFLSESAEYKKWDSDRAMVKQQAKDRQLEASIKADDMVDGVDMSIKKSPWRALQSEFSSRKLITKALKAFPGMSD